MAEKLLSGKLLKDRFFLLDELGMYWDLNLIKRQWISDLVKLNGTFMDIHSELLKNDKCQEWYGALMATKGQLAGITPEWQGKLAPKAYLMLAWPEFDDRVSPLAGPWERADFIWISNDLVWSRWNGDQLNYRFPQVSKDFVDISKNEYAPVTPPPVTHPAEDPEDPGTPEEPGTPSGGLVLHLNCPHCGKKIF